MALGALGALAALAARELKARGGRGLGWKALQALAVLHPRARLSGLLAQRGGALGTAAGVVGGAAGQALAVPVLVLTAAPPLIELLHPDLALSLRRSLTFYRHVSAIFVSYVRTALVETKGLDGPAAQAVWDARHEAGAEAVVRLLEELSGFYLKVGQVFATKQDLFPPQYVRKLSFLYDACPPAPAEEVVETIEQSLGKPLLEIFEYFDYEPLATATIAQVHRARMVPTGRPVVVKVQRQGMEKLMRQDMGNMLFFASFMHRLGFDLKIDQVSILREYQAQVPLEFDFVREARLVEIVGGSIRRDPANALVEVPEVMPALSSEAVLTMSFLEGPSLNKALKLMEQQPDEPLNRRRSTLELAGEAGPEASISVPPELEVERELFEKLKFQPSAFLHNLIRSYGQQIFLDGVFHSDPHPGNILALPKQKVGLIDFGECKELSDETRLKFARLTVALAWRDQEKAVPILEEMGVHLDNVPVEFRMVGAYLMFDTRMDIPEAHFSPLDPDAPEEFRQVSMGSFPQEYFMLLRVTALLRGLLAAFGEDISSALIWEKYAQAALKKAGVPAPRPPLPARVGAFGGGRAGRGGGKGATSSKQAALTSIYTRMRVLAEWLQSYGFPHDRRTLTPLATSGLTTVEEINEAFREGNSALIEVALARFSPEQRERIESLARDYVELTQAAVEVTSQDLKQEARERRRLSANNGGGAQAVDDAESRLDASGAAEQKKKKASSWKKFKAAFKTAKVKGR